MPMPLIAIVSGLLLIGVGVAGYTLAEAESAVTALIPAAVGLLIARRASWPPRSRELVSTRCTPPPPLGCSAFSPPVGGSQWCSLRAKAARSAARPSGR